MTVGQSPEISYGRTSRYSRDTDIHLSNRRFVGEVHCVKDVMWCLLRRRAQRLHSRSAARTVCITSTADWTNGNDFMNVIYDNDIFLLSRGELAKSHEYLISAGNYDDACWARYPGRDVAAHRTNTFNPLLIIG